ncbi:MAG TPA: gamma-glutamylcyclotransferase family protein [Pyrinomonadaceae bacterium]|nr:gamma-glutamylcyclotransferase family protein [Pyrinomonadaceae bacterium]
MPGRVDVFFYGLFMDEALLREKGLDPQNRRLASLENFSLVVGARASLVPSEGSRVYGVLFSLDHREVDLLYSDASVSAYRPEIVTANLDEGSVARALCYNLPGPPSTEERNPQYASKLRKLAEDIGLPSNYIASIQ